MRLVTALCWLPIGVLGACKGRVDTQDFESRIRGRVTELGLPVTAVTCPREVEVRAGATFTCTVELAGKPYLLDATIAEALPSGESAEVQLATRWQGGDGIVGGKLAAALSKALTESLATPVQITCGDPLRFLAPDRTLRCAFAGGGVQTSIVTTFDDKLDPKSWKLDPPAIATSALVAAIGPDVRAKVPGAQIACGTTPLLLRPADGSVPCTLAAGGRTAKVAVTVDDQLAPKRWEIVDDAPRTP